MQQPVLKTVPDTQEHKNNAKATLTKGRQSPRPNLANNLLRGRAVASVTKFSLRHQTDTHAIVGHKKISKHKAF